MAVGGEEGRPPFSGTVIDVKRGISHEWGTSSSLRVESQLVGASKWKAMRNLTASDKGERVVIVSTNGKRLMTSKIFRGSWQFDIAFPQGIRSAIDFGNDLVATHTHPMNPELQIPTGSFPDNDINFFANSSLKALIMIDEGGIHLLAKNLYIPPADGEAKIKVEKDAIEEAIQGENNAKALRQGIAKRIKPLGLRYYFAEMQDEFGEYIDFKEVA